MTNQFLQLTIKQLLAADAHLGNYTKQRNPDNTSNILGTHDKKDIINLEKTLQSLEPAINIIIDSIANYETLLIVAQHPSADQVEITQPLLTSKWVHGGLSNFKTIKLSQKNTFFHELQRIPSVIVIVYSKNDSIILNEAKLLEIPTIGFCDTTENPRQILYPIPSSHSSEIIIQLYLKLIGQACFYGYAKNILYFKQDNNPTQND